MDISKDTARSVGGSPHRKKPNKKAASKRGLDGTFVQLPVSRYFVVGVVVCGLAAGGAGLLAGAPACGLVVAGRTGAATPDCTL
jgi:hypothetical protein